MRIPSYHDIRQHISSLKELTREGYSPAKLTRMVQEYGPLHRIATGVYADRTRWQGWGADERIYAVHLAYALTHRRFYFSHTYAAMFHGFDLLHTPDEVHIIAHGATRPGRKSAVCHRSTEAVLSQCMRTPELMPVTSPLQTVLDCAKTLPFANAVVLADSAMRQGGSHPLVAPSELHAELSEYSGYRKGRVSRVAAAIGGASGSAAETLARLAIAGFGFPAPVQQHPVRTHRGRYYLDFAWEKHRLFLEVDGRSKYFLSPGRTDETVYREHTRQRDIERATGFRCVRVRWEDIYPSPAGLYRALAPYLRMMR